jgi:hypothetical protein
MIRQASNENESEETKSFILINGTIPQEDIAV